MKALVCIPLREYTWDIWPVIMNTNKTAVNVERQFLQPSNADKLLQFFLAAENQMHVNLVWG